MRFRILFLGGRDIHKAADRIHSVLLYPWKISNSYTHCT